MRIFHGLNNIGAMATTLARAHRALGHEAQALCYPSPTFAMQGDGTWAPRLLQFAGADLSYLPHASLSRSGRSRLLPSPCESRVTRGRLSGLRHCARSG
jgi:hypothetical protein